MALPVKNTFSNNGVKFVQPQIDLDNHLCEVFRQLIPRMTSLQDG